MELGACELRGTLQAGLGVQDTVWAGAEAPCAVSFPQSPSVPPDEGACAPGVLPQGLRSPPSQVRPRSPSAFRWLFSCPLTTTLMS